MAAKRTLTQDTIDEQLDALDMLLVESEKFMIGLIPDGSSRINFRRQCLTHMFVLSLNTADGVIALLRAENLFPAGILARSILEQWINMQYIYATASYENLVRYLYDGDAFFIKNTTELGRLYAAVNSEGDFDALIDDTAGGVAFRVQSSNDLKRYGYPCKKMPPLLDRIRFIDRKNDSMELITSYYYDYTYLSTHVHTTKDKIIEMTYADTYQEWRQATSQGDLPHQTAYMSNRIGYFIEQMVKFYAKKHRTPMPLNLLNLVKARNYIVLIHS